MWREIFMSASILASIILAVVGICKTPFKTFKAKHPKTYRAVFFILSLLLVVGGSIISELYIIEGTLLSVEFAILIISTGFVVFGGYAGYENLGIKTLVHKITGGLKSLFSTYSDSKIAKMIGQVGIDRINEIYNATTTTIVEEKTVDAVVVEEPKLEPEIIIEENKTNE